MPGITADSEMAEGDVLGRLDDVLSRCGHQFGEATVVGPSGSVRSGAHPDAGSRG